MGEHGGAADDSVLGRAIFYVADDGVLERSSSSTPPSGYADGFQERFHSRCDRT